MTALAVLQRNMPLMVKIYLTKVWLSIYIISVLFDTSITLAQQTTQGNPSYDSLVQRVTFLERIVLQQPYANMMLTDYMSMKRPYPHTAVQVPHSYCAMPWPTVLPKEELNSNSSTEFSNSNCSTPVMSREEQLFTETPMYTRVEPVFTKPTEIQPDEPAITISMSPTEASSLDDKSSSPSPIKITSKKPLPEIDYEKLSSPEEIVNKHSKLLKVSKIPTLAVKLAKGSFFGNNIMVSCTVRGLGSYHALPQGQLKKLKSFYKTCVYRG